MSNIVERLEGWTRTLRAQADERLGADLREAISEINRLRAIAGKADVGQSFAELTSELRHQTPVEQEPFGA